MTTFDLSAVTLLGGSTYSGGEIHPNAGWVEFIDPTYEIDRGSAGYTIEIDVRLLSGPGYEVGVLGTANSSGAGPWRTYGYELNMTASAGEFTITLPMGPGVEDWDLAASDQTFLDFNISGCDILAVRITDGFPPDPPAALFDLDFEDFTLSDPIDDAEFNAGFNAGLSSGSLTNLAVVDDGTSQRFQITMPANSNAGIQASIALDTPTNVIWFYQDIIWPVGVPFGKGGKLNGFGGGSHPTGGGGPYPDGWSLRWMWREDGRLQLYAYHPDQPDEFGEGLWTDYFLTPGEPLRLGLGADVDTGAIAGTVGGESAYTETLDLLGLPASHFLLSTFRGGDITWAESVDTPLLFDNMLLTASETVDPGDGGEYDATVDAEDVLYGLELDCSGFMSVRPILDPSIPTGRPQRIQVPTSPPPVLVDGRPQ